MIAPRRIQSVHLQRQPHQHGNALMSAQKRWYKFYLYTYLSFLWYVLTTSCYVELRAWTIGLACMNLELCQCPLKWRWKLGGLEILKPDCMCAIMSPVDAIRSNQLGMSIWFCPLPWYGTFLTPYGELKQREHLHTCCMQKKFEKFYAFLFIAWVAWLHMCLHVFTISMNLACIAIHVIFMFKHAFLD